MLFRSNVFEMRSQVYKSQRLFVLHLTQRKERPLSIGRYPEIGHLQGISGFEELGFGECNGLRCLSRQSIHVEVTKESKNFFYLHDWLDLHDWHIQPSMHFCLHSFQFATKIDR